MIVWNREVFKKRLVSRQSLRRAAREENKLDVDPGVTLDHPSGAAPLGTPEKRAYPRLLYVTPSA